MLKRLSRNKRSGERAGEWRGLIGDEFEMERKKEFRGTSEEGREDWKKCGFAMKALHE